MSVRSMPSQSESHPRASRTICARSLTVVSLMRSDFIVFVACDVLGGSLVRAPFGRKVRVLVGATKLRIFCDFRKCWIRKICFYLCL